MRKHTFEISQYYHIYNRGVDKRDIVIDIKDLNRLLQSFVEFNSEKSIGSIYENSFVKNKFGSPTSKLVDIVAYCINPNHFHLLMTPLVDNGIEKFMQRIGGYTKYFNEKYDRSGVLFQGKFKSKHVADDRYLLHVSVYINNNNLDSLGSPTSKLSISSLGEYLNKSKVDDICNTDIVLGQFRDVKEYKKYSEETWKDICKRKEDLDPK
jgi:REP element-mobilizing transposase RayT